VPGGPAANGAPTTLARFDPSCRNTPPGLLEAYGYGCGVYVNLIRDAYRRKCQMECDPCWLMLLDQSIGRQSWPMVRNQIGRTFLRFPPSAYVQATQPAPDPDSTATVNFVASVPISPGEAILLRQEARYTLPWRPGCLKLTLGFSAGDMANNMTHVSVKAYVMARGALQTSGPLRAFAVEWTPDEFYTGDQFRCGDNCAEVQIIGSLGCGGVEHVGDDNELLIVVANDAAATNDITAIDAKISFDGLRKKCCDDCGSGKSCSCGG
jgi:hypothetical protein